MKVIADTLAGDIAAAVRSLIGERRASVSALAEALRLSRSATSSRVNGRSAFDAVEIDRAAAFFGLTAYELIDRAEQISESTPTYKEPAA